MPNRCRNNFEAHGTKGQEELDSFLAKLINKEGKPSYHMAVPIPDEVETKMVPHSEIFETAEERKAYVEEQNEKSGLTYLESQFWIREDMEKMKEEFWYTDWRNAHVCLRGTKWDLNIYQENIDTTANEDWTWSVLMWFESPWSPPSEWFKVLCELFPDIEFSLSYEEPGMNFEWDIHSDGEGWYWEENREYEPMCDYCEEKKEEVKYYDFEWQYYCDTCVWEVLDEADLIFDKKKFDTLNNSDKTDFLYDLQSAFHLEDMQEVINKFHL